MFAAVRLSVLLFPPSFLRRSCVSQQPYSSFLAAQGKELIVPEQQTTELKAVWHKLRNQAMDFYPDRSPAALFFSFCLLPLSPLVSGIGILSFCEMTLTFVCFDRIWLYAGKETALWGRGKQIGDLKALLRYGHYETQVMTFTSLDIAPVCTNNHLPLPLSRAVPAAWLLPLPNIPSSNKFLTSMNLLPGPRGLLGSAHPRHCLPSVRGIP